MDRTIFQQAFGRCLLLAEPEDIYIVTNANYKFLVMTQIEDMGVDFDDSNLLVEPMGRNTLPAIYFAVRQIQKKGEDIAVVFPSDHIINDEHKFTYIIKSSQQLAREYIVTYGIYPSQPHTGYGYIKPEEPLEMGYGVDEFKEKPDPETAREYIEKGYLWNSGMFMFRTDIFQEEVMIHAPDVHQAFLCEGVKDIYSKTPAVSIDYAIMEKSNRVAVMPMDIKWSDLGSFDAFYGEFGIEQGDNADYGDNIMIEASNNLLMADKGKKVALIGVNDLIVIDERDALLICKKEHSQRVKDVVEQLRAEKDPRADFNSTVHRPWGSFTVLEDGAFYKIKRITVLPGKKLSYQLHHHRSEYWIVVRGTAMVTIDNSEKMVRSGEKVFIQTGLKHRLENPGKVLLEVIEVQLGEYLEEDDIVRFEDDFGRCS
jgi:mannose-1-phosphate guanylyltransferase/mannose-6-phosphate isomerase